MSFFVRHAQADEAGKALHLEWGIIPGNPAGDFFLCFFDARRHRVTEFRSWTDTDHPRIIPLSSSEFQLRSNPRMTPWNSGELISQTWQNHVF